MPQLHSELPSSRIEDVVAVNGVIFVLTKDGEIYASLTAEQAHENRFKHKAMVRKLEKPFLPNLSMVERFVSI